MRSQSILNLILLFSFFITLIFAQEQTHPIDDYLNECLAADSSTASMSNCTTEAYVLWDEELNTVYTNLLATLTPEEQETLRHAQRQWLMFRDAEFELINTLYDRQEGTMYIPMRLGDRYEVVRERVLQLMWYLELLEQGN